MENINAKRATKKEEFNGKVCWDDYWFQSRYRPGGAQRVPGS
jgi:hypothetical protein